MKTKFEEFIYNPVFMLVIGMILFVVGFLDSAILDHNNFEELTLIGKIAFMGFMINLAWLIYILIFKRIEK